MLRISARMQSKIQRKNLILTYHISRTCEGKFILSSKLLLGITSLVALSNGEKIANPKGFKAKRTKLKRAQKALARKQKGSRNREKARIKVARVHQEIADARKDFLHKLTTQLVRENQTIVVEDLAVKNLVKNHKLALAIRDCSWGELVRQLEYKCEWYGRTLVKIDR